MGADTSGCVSGAVVSVVTQLSRSLGARVRRHCTRSPEAGGRGPGATDAKTIHRTGECEQHKREQTEPKPPSQHQPSKQDTTPSKAQGERPQRNTSRARSSQRGEASTRGPEAKGRARQGRGDDGDGQLHAEPVLKQVNASRVMGAPLLTAGKESVSTKGENL